MSKSVKKKSSDDLIKEGVEIITELSDRGINFFQTCVDLCGKVKKGGKRIKNIIKTAKEASDAK